LWQTGICVHTHSLWQTGICFHTSCDKQGSVSTQFVINRDLSQTVRTQIPVYHKLCGHRTLFVTNCVDTDPCLSQIVWTQILVCHKLCGHRSLLITNCVDTDPCSNRDLCPHNLWKAGICFHTGCDKQGSVSTQFVTNRDLCSHSLWQTRICVHTHSLWQTGHKLCGHRSLFVKTCVDTDPCLSQIVWTQIPVCHNLCENKSLFRGLCPHSLWQTGICVNTVCDKQGSVST
jgi:hypothetical protein